MDPLKQLCERLTAATAEIDEMLGTEEKPREEPLSDEDRAKLDELDKECEKLNADIDKAKADQAAEQELRKRQAARKTALSTQTQGRKTTPDTPGTLAPQSEPEDLTIVPMRRARGQQIFKEDRDAYACGCWLLAKFGDPELEVVQRAHRWCREHLAMSTTAIAKGGALVPDAFERAVIDLREQYGVFRREAKVWPMSSDTTIKPRRTGGLTAYAVGDNAEITASDKSWDQVELTARKIGVLARYSSELDEDSIIAVAEDLASEGAYALAKYEDDCGFLGDGTATYSGIQGLITKCTAATASTVTAATGNTAFSTLDLTDFEDMVGLLPQYAEVGAKWYISKIGWAASMLRLIEAAGGQTGAMIAGQVQKMFLGYPVVISQVMNTTTAAQTSTYGLAYLGDLKMAAALGDRRGIRVKTSEHRYLEYDQLGITVTERFAINVHDVGDTSSAGPMIMLATPGS